MTTTFRVLPTTAAARIAPMLDVLTREPRPTVASVAEQLADISSKPDEIRRWSAVAEMVTLSRPDGSIAYFMDVRDEAGKLIASSVFNSERELREAARSVARCETL